MTDPSALWHFLLVGYLASVAVEAPILVVGLSPRHRLRDRLFAGFWLTACTYPIVVLVMPVALAGAPRAVYLAVAETFAPAAECALFWLAFGRDGRATWRDMVAITVANLASFAAGAILF